MQMTEKGDAEQERRCRQHTREVKMDTSTREVMKQTDAGEGTYLKAGVERTVMMTQMSMQMQK